MEDLPDEEKEMDPLRHAAIIQCVEGKYFKGWVEDIECGKTTKMWLYRIKYEDGDQEHMTAEQVKENMVKDETVETTKLTTKIDQMPFRPAQTKVPPSLPLALQLHFNFRPRSVSMLTAE